MAQMIPSEHRREFIEGPLEEAAIEANNDVSFLDYFDKNGEAVIIVFDDDSKKVVDIKGKSLDEVTAEIMKAIS